MISPDDRPTNLNKPQMDKTESLSVFVWISLHPLYPHVRGPTIVKYNFDLHFCDLSSSEI